MTEKRALRGDDILHMTLASQTGAAVAMEAPIALDEVAGYVLSQMAPAPTMDEIVAAVLAKMAPVAEPAAAVEPAAPAV